MTTPTSQSSDTISLRPALISLAVVIIVIAIGMGIALQANQQRRQTVIDTYTTATKEHYGQNQAAYEDFFAKTFTECQTELTKQQATETTTYKSSDIICQAAIKQLSSMRVDSLQDSSAIAYVKITNGTYELIEASGKYNQGRSIFDTQNYNHFNYDQHVKQDIADYATDRKPITRWQDFINYIGGKEVVVTLEKDGTPIGYIFRGVIER